MTDSKATGPRIPQKDPEMDAILEKGGFCVTMIKCVERYTHIASIIISRGPEVTESDLRVLHAIMRRLDSGDMRVLHYLFNKDYP